MNEQPDWYWGLGGGIGRFVHIKCWLLGIAILSLEIDVTHIYCVILWLGNRFLTAKI
jgi:hypothetical protein